MCGRLILDKDIDIVEKRFLAGVQGKHAWIPSYNVAPSQTLPIVTRPGIIEVLSWGYKPKWADKDVINARIEGLHEKPYFRDAKRCLVPTTGFYEWKNDGDKKIPHFIHFPDSHLFAFAGVYNSDGFAIITESADKRMEHIHHRMPAILRETAEKDWLQGHELKTDKSDLELYPISTLVNNPKNNSPQLTQRLYI
jgi:putative SOS response-associated peptidase YedK